MKDIPAPAAHARGARIVVVGGGIGGVSAAYHLAMLGVREVLLLERGRLGSGTTGHSTGNMETYRPNPLIFGMVRYAAEIYPRIARESGQDIGWRAVGRVMYAEREERFEHMRTLPELGRALGIDLELLSPAAVAERLPIISREGLLGGLWIPSDARVNPSDAVSAFAHLARARGVTIREQTPVLGILRSDDRVRGVATADGEIACDTVVLAGGLWSADLAKSCGISLPLYALEHQYLITRPFGVARHLPLFLCFDDELYGREEVGGLLVGSLDENAIPIATSQIPENVDSCLLPERWEQFELHMERAMRRFPALQTTPIKMLLNGPESFTPDGQMLLGPVPGLGGLYAMCAFNSNGMALAPAAGRFIAEWIVEGAPSADVAALDVRRFSKEQSADSYLRARVSEIPSYYCRMRTEVDDYTTARDLRRSPLHAELAARGARFASVNGWERALHAGNSEPRMSWPSAVAHEAAGAAESVLLVDRSADVKYLLSGAGARAWLLGRAPPFIDREARALLTALPGSHLEVEVLCRILERPGDECLLTAGPEQETRLGEWLRLNLPSHLRAVDQTHGRGCLELHGPRRRALLARALDGAPIDVLEDPVADSTLIITSSESAVAVWQRLCALASELDLRVGGHLAEEAVRIARGLPAFGREVGPQVLVSEARNAGASPRAPAPPLALLAVPRTHRPCVLVAFTSPAPVVGFGGREMILEEGRAVGEVTSRVRLPGWEATLALGRLDTAHFRGGALHFVVSGKTWPLVPRSSAWQAALAGTSA